MNMIDKTFKSLVKQVFPRLKKISDDDSLEQFVIISDDDAPKIIRENLQNASNELERIVYSNKDRRIFKWHHYLAIYDRYFAPLKSYAASLKGEKDSIFAPNGQLRILELGVQNGGSLQMWRKYFGPDAIIFGIDIDQNCAAFESKGTNVRIGDQSNPEFLKSVTDEMGGIDIVIDDGSHIASHQLASFRYLFPEISNGGVYICEDLHTAYWDGWEGGFRRPGTFIETGKSIVDHMHEWYAGIDTELNGMDLKRSVLSVAFYDSLIAIEKGEKTRPYAIHVGESSF